MIKDNKKYIVVGIALIFLVGVIVVVGINSLNKEAPAIKNETEKTETNSSKGVGENDYLPMIDKDKDKGITHGKPDGRSLSIPEAKAIEIEARKLIYDFKFIDADELIQEKISEFNLDNSEGYEYLKPLYNDLVMLSKLQEMTDYGYKKEVRDKVRNMKDVESFLVGFLWLDSEERIYMISDVGSLNPDFYGGLIIKSKSEVDKNSDIYKKASILNKNTNSMTEILFNIEGYDLKAYVGSTDNNFYLQTIQKIDEKAPFLTIIEWQELMGEIYDNLGIESVEEATTQDVGSDD